MKPTLSYRLSMSRPRYVAGESIHFDIAIENHGSDPVQVPDPRDNRNSQPIWTLENSMGGKQVVDFRSKVHGRSRRGPANSAAYLVTIAPGETWTTTMNLETFFETPGPGRSTLRSRMAWKDIRVDSTPLSFDIEELRPVSASLSLAGRGDPEIWAAWIHNGEQESLLFQGAFAEMPGSPARIERQGVIPPSQVSAAATDVQMPVSETSRFSDLFSMILWREGRTLVVDRPAGGTCRLAFDLENSFIAAPTWLSARRLMVVIAGRGADQKSFFALARFVDGGHGKPPSGTLLWQHPLPAASVAGGAFYEPESDTLHAVFLVPARPGFDVVHAASKGGAPPERLDRVHLAENELVDDSRPAVSADPSGSSRAGFVARSAKRPQEHYFVEVSFGQGAPPPRRGVACSLDQPAVAARAGYGRTATGFRPDWALLTRNGDVYAHAAGDGAPLARTRHPSKATFEIVVLRDVTYLLRPAKGGLELLPL